MGLYTRSYEQILKRGVMDYEDNRRLFKYVIRG